MAKGNSFEIHDFYCLNCGNKALPLARKQSHKHEKLHRKSLYCPYCKLEINCIEICTKEEKEWFIEEFQKGNFKAEAIASIQYLEENKNG